MDYTHKEMMTIVAAREIRNDDIVFCGTGISMLAAMAAKILMPLKVLFFLKQAPLILNWKIFRWQWQTRESCISPHQMPGFLKPLVRCRTRPRADMSWEFWERPRSIFTGI